MALTWQTDSSTLILAMSSFSSTPGAEFICNFSLMDSLFLTAAWNWLTPAWYSPAANSKVT